MAIDRHIFYCPICGHSWFTKKQCEECEVSHLQPKEIVSAGYYPDYEDYPTEIVVRFEDGFDIRYVAEEYCKE